MVQPNFSGHRTIVPFVFFVCLATAVFRGDAHAHATVLTLGSNDEGRTGIGTVVGDTLVPTPIDTSNLAGKSITHAVAAWQHSLLLADDGTVFSFGINDSARTGLGTTSGNALVATPIDTTLLGDSKIVQMAAGPWHNLLVAEDGVVYSFGANQFGRTGRGISDGNTLVATPISMARLGARKFVQAAAGRDHSLILADDGVVFAFGNNDFGQTGLLTESRGVLNPTAINPSNLGGRKISSIAAGDDRSLLLADDGTVFSFGFNTSGGTGLGIINDAITPIATPIIDTNFADKRIVQIAAGSGRNSLLLADDGTVFYFGPKWLGGLDSPTWESDIAAIATPIVTTNLDDARITQVAISGGHSLLLADDGRVFSFGFNSNGQTGGGGRIAKQIDFPQLANLHITQVVAGSGYSLLIGVPTTTLPEPGGLTLFGIAALSVTVSRPRARKVNPKTLQVSGNPHEYANSTAL